MKKKYIIPKNIMLSSTSSSVFRKGTPLANSGEPLELIDKIHISPLQSSNIVRICYNVYGVALYLWKHTDHRAIGMNEISMQQEASEKAGDACGKLLCAWENKGVHTLWKFERHMPDLFHYLTNDPRGDILHNTVFVLQNIAQVLVASQLVHNDLSPENILVAYRRNMRFTDVRLIDWAFAAHPGDSFKDVRGKEYCMPPEMLVDTKIARSSIDVYSLGVVGFTIISGGTSPFARPNIVVSGEELKQYVQKASKIKCVWLCKLIAQCMEPRPERRPSLSKILDEIQKKE